MNYLAAGAAASSQFSAGFVACALANIAPIACIVIFLGLAGAGMRTAGAGAIVLAGFGDTVAFIFIGIRAGHWR